MAAIRRTGSGLVYTPTSGAMKGSRFYIKNADLLSRIAKMTGYTERYLVRDAAMAAFSLAEEAYEGTPEAIRGKYLIEVSQSSQEGYLVEATVLKEPADRRPDRRATVMVDKAGRVLHSRRYKYLKEVPSISAYVARELHISFAKAVEKTRARSSDIVIARMLEAAKRFNIKVRGVQPRAPVGGVEVAGKYYKGGQFIPL